MILYSAYVTIQHRGDETLRKTVLVVVKSDDTEIVKRSTETLKRALKYSGYTPKAIEDLSRWYIKNVVLDKKLGL